MPIEFKGSPEPTLGIEVEIQLLDRTTKNMMSSAFKVLKEAESVEGLNLKSELHQAMVEINTEICHTVREAGLSLKRQFDLLRRITDSQGLELAVSGTHPFDDWRERRVFPSQRYVGILEKFQWLARRWSTFGLHVHVGLADGERAIHVMNALINYIPHLLALSASSPFWGGLDTGLASSRIAVIESLPTGGLPYFFPSWKEFEKYFDTLTGTGAIGSIKDIYWDIRPHFDFGTIEVRICDGAPTLKQTLALAALIQCLVVWIDVQYQRGERSRQVRMQRYWLAPENKWQAARYGLQGQIITQEGSERHLLREEIAKLFETLQPIAKSLNCAQEFSHIETMIKEGSSSVRQREVFARTGSLVSVVEQLINEFKVC